MKELSFREKVLVLLTGLAAGFLLYWYLLLNPLLKAGDKISADLKATQLQAQQALALTKVKPARPTLQAIRIFPKEEQLSYLLNSLDQKFRWYGIELITLNQAAAANILTLNLTFQSTYYQLLGLLNTFADFNTALVIDTVNVTQSGDRMVTQMRLLSGYK